MLEVSFSTSNYDKLLNGLPKILKRARTSAINKALVQGMNVGLRAMSKVYNLPTRRLKKGMRIKKATPGGTFGFIIAQEKKRAVIGTDRPGLIGYRGTSQKVKTRGGVRKLSRTKTGALQASTRTFKSAGKGGVDVTIIKGKKHRLSRAFITSGNTGGARAANVFRRTGIKKIPVKGAYKGRTLTRGPFRGLPLQREVIKRLSGPSIPSMFLVRGRPAAAKWVRANLSRLFANQVQRLRRSLTTKGKR